MKSYSCPFSATRVIVVCLESAAYGVCMHVRERRWEPNSYGYHGDDGRKFLNSGKGEEYGPTYGTGDSVGAGLHFGKQEIFFT